MSSSPRRLGPYEVLRRLGAGGMAEVYLARRYGAAGWDKLVAVKVLRPELRGRAELERLLISEARLGARFAHPGLIHVHDLGFAEGTYYVCMDYVDGRDLAALIRARPLPRALALLVAEQLAAALAYVHALTDRSGRPLGLVHRDVSPGNVLVSRTGEVKLSDFGIAKATAERDETWGRLRLGKYAYMAPEQVTGEPLGPAADLFALAVTLHECLLARRPFVGETHLELMEAIRSAQLGAEHDFGDLSVELVELLRIKLARDPRQRLGEGAAGLARQLSALRRAHPPVSSFDLAEWVAGVLVDAGESGVRPEPRFETLAMDEEPS